VIKSIAMKREIKLYQFFIVAPVLW